MPGQHEVIAELRERIRRIERRPARSDRVVATGRPAVDRLLGGGFPRGAVTELCGPPASGKTAVALSALARATGEGALAAYVDARGELYAPAASALGVDLDLLLIVRPPVPVARAASRDLAPGAVDALWAAEALLGSGAFAAVAVDVPLAAGARSRRGGATADAMLRRIQGAAERGGAAALWLGEPGGSRVPAALRLEVEAGPDGPVVRHAGGRREQAGHAA